MKFVAIDGKPRSLLLNPKPPYRWFEMASPIYETDDPDEIALLDANPGMARVGGELKADEEVLEFEEVKEGNTTVATKVSVRTKRGSKAISMEV